LKPTRRVFAKRIAQGLAWVGWPASVKPEPAKAQKVHSEPTVVETGMSKAKGDQAGLMPSHDELALALAQALRHAIESTSPSMRDPFPTIDCSLVLLPPLRPQTFREKAHAQARGMTSEIGKKMDSETGVSQGCWAHVLIQAGYPEGLRGDLDPITASGPHNISYLADPVNSVKDSIAWLPGSDWRQFEGLRAFTGNGPHRVIAPYPASVIKLMVAVGVCLLADRQLIEWQDPVAVGRERLDVQSCCDQMITLSSNEATDALVRLLHQRGLIDRSTNRNDLNAHFQAFGLDGLRLDNTTELGGWRNPDGAGVGQLQMTSWDCVRLLWLMLDAAGSAGVRPPWLSASGASNLWPATDNVLGFVSEDSANRFWRWMRDQARHELLSSGLLAGLPGWVAGIPAALPDRWINADHQAQIDHESWPGNARVHQSAATLRFAHKTGSTWSYAANAGLVESIMPGGRRYLIAMMSTLGMRHAAQPQTVTPWLIPAFGAQIDAWIAQRLG